MKKVLLILTCALLLVGGVKTANACETKEGECVTSKFPFKVYGFIRGEAAWTDSQVLSTSVNNAAAGNISLIAPSTALDETAFPKNDAATEFTASNTRIGMDWVGTKLSESLSAGGKLEMDFFNIGGGMSPRPRMRLAYAELKGTNWSLVGGQHWDIFAPLNARDFINNNNMWYTGNLGFRRPQARFTYDWRMEEGSGLTFATSMNNPGNADNFASSGIDSGIPYFEGALKYYSLFDERPMSFGISGAAGREHDATFGKTTMWGISADVVFPAFEYFQMQAEVIYGQALDSFLSAADMANNTADTKTISTWGQVTSQWHEKFETNIGYGLEDPLGDGIAAGNIERNTTAFFNAQYFPVKPFGIGIEYANIRTKYRGTGTSQANYVLTALTYKF